MPKDMKILKRSEMDPAACWNTADLYPTDEAWEAGFGACQGLADEAAAYRGRLGESAQTLYDYLSWSEQANQQVEKLFVYAFIKNDEDTANPVYQAMKGRCFSFVVQLSSAVAFEGPELVAIPDGDLERFYREKPELEKFRRYLDKARLEKDHVLSPPRRTCWPRPARWVRGRAASSTPSTTPTCASPPWQTARGRSTP